MKISSRVFTCSMLFAAALHSQAAGPGKPLFVARCAGCHGEDGTGGGLGPGILEVRNTRVTSRQAIRDLIRKGIPEVGMPAFPIVPYPPFVPIVPLPTKYRVYFGEPMTFTGDPDDDEEVLDDKVKQVKHRIQAMLHVGLRERAHVFW